MRRASFKDPWPKEWLSVVNLVRFDRCVIICKIVNKQCPESLWNMSNRDVLYQIIIRGIIEVSIFPS